MKSSNLQHTRTDSQVAFDWRWGSPAPGVPSDRFSVRWTGDFSFNAGTYTFTATGDDGIRLYVDGVLILNGWRNQVATTYQADRQLTAGTHRVRVEYYDETDVAVARVSWALAGTPVSTTDTTAPTTPSNLQAAAASTSQINLSWSASTDNVGVSGYRVFRAGQQIATTSGTTFQNTGLTAGTTYSYSVAAFDAAGNVSAQSAAVSATTTAAATTDTSAPSVPSNLQAAVASASQINLSWTASTDNVGVAGYRVFRAGQQIATTGGTTFQNTGLNASTTYSYSVAAYDAAGNVSGQTVAVSATTSAAATSGGVDIRNHGAACDGVTNDTGAILRAIDAVPASGGSVDIPCMVAIGAPGILVNGRSNLTIRGTTQGAGFKAYTTDGGWSFGYPMILAIRSCSNCAVRGLLFEGNRLAVGMLRLEGNTGSTVENNVIRNVGKTVTAALMLMGGRDNKVLGNTVDTTEVDMRGIWVGNPGSDLEYNPTIRFNTVRNAASFGTGRDGTGLTATLVGGLVSNNLCEYNMGAGLKINPLETAQVVIENNRSVFNGWSGITIGSAGNIVVRNNYVEGTRLTGIGIDSGATGTISGNVIFNNNRNGDQGWLGGIYLRGANNLTIEKNRIYDTNPSSSPRQDHGIRLDPEGAITNLQIIDNLISNNSFSGINVEARFSGSSVDGVTVRGNTFTSNSIGIYINQVNANTIRNFSVFSNCFANNGTTVRDNRGQLSQQPTSSSCPEPAGLPTAP